MILFPTLLPVFNETKGSQDDIFSYSFNINMYVLYMHTQKIYNLKFLNCS